MAAIAFLGRKEASNKKRPMEKVLNNLQGPRLNFCLQHLSNQSGKSGLGVLLWQLASESEINQSDQPKVNPYTPDNSHGTLQSAKKEEENHLNQTFILWFLNTNFPGC